MNTLTADPEDTETATSEMRPKARRVVEAALKLFLANGYDQVSTDMIAQEAGVSKATVYAYFPSKEELFFAVIRGNCSDMAMKVSIPAAFEPDLEPSLVRIGCDLLKLFGDPKDVRLYRLLVGEVHRFPKLALTFEAIGPADVHRRMAAYFRLATEAGALSMTNFEAASDLFLALVLGRLPFDQALGLPAWDEDRSRARIEVAVAVFLRGVAAL